jgi:imidazolonepropionase-like amidohydrolase
MLPMWRLGDAVLGVSGLLLSVCACAPVRLASVSFAGEADVPFLIQNVAVFDQGTLKPAQDVLIRGGRVRGVGSTGTLLLPSNLERVPGEGRTLLPGLVEMHAHLLGSGGPPWSVHRPDPEANLRAFLYAGVTSVLVAQHADSPCPFVESLAKIATSQPAPHLFQAGPGLTAPGGHPAPITRALAPTLLRPCLPAVPAARDAEEARTEVRRVASRHRPRFYKIFHEAVPSSILKPNGAPVLTLDALVAAVSEAEKLGMYPIAHIGSSKEMMEVIRAGVKLVMHAPYHDRLCPEQINEIKDKRPEVRFVTTATLFSASAGLEGDKATAFDRIVAERGFFAAFRARPRAWQNAMRGDFNLGAYEQHFSEYRDNMTENIRALIQAKVGFFVGTDASLPGILPGAGLHAEIADLVASRIVTPAEVLQVATTEAAHFLEPDADIGRVAEGYRADLLMVEGNPVEDIDRIDHIYAVILGGRRLRRAEP